jgi:hypothetical protein
MPLFMKIARRNSLLFGVVASHRLHQNVVIGEELTFQ